LSFHRVKDGIVVQTWPERPREFWTESLGAISNLHAASPLELAKLGLYDGVPEAPPAIESRIERLAPAPRFEPGAPIEGPLGSGGGLGRVVEGWEVVQLTPGERAAERASLAAGVRMRCREKLIQTAHLLGEDAPLSPAERSALIAYRGALWALITNPPADPHDAQMPAVPALRAGLLD